MNAHLQSTNAGNVGARLGRVWRKLLRREKQFAQWLMSKGVPVGVTKASVWITKFIVLAILLYFSLPVAMLIAALVIVAAVAAHADLSANQDPDQDHYDWRDGPQGHGMYNSNGDRIDPYDHTEQP